MVWRMGWAGRWVGIGNTSASERARVRQNYRRGAESAEAAEDRRVARSRAVRVLGVRVTGELAPGLNRRDTERQSSWWAGSRAVRVLGIDTEGTEGTESTEAQGIGACGNEHTSPRSRSLCGLCGLCPLCVYFSARVARGRTARADARALDLGIRASNAAPKRGLCVSVSLWFRKAM